MGKIVGLGNKKEALTIVKESIENFKNKIYFESNSLANTPALPKSIFPE